VAPAHRAARFEDFHNFVRMHRRSKNTYFERIWLSYRYLNHR